MPLWRIFCHPSTFTTDQKRGLAKAITKHYTDAPLNFPAFYVNVFFVPLLEDELWIGGEPRKNFVRIAIEQIAKHLPALGQPGGQRRAAMMEEIEEVSKSFLWRLARSVVLFKRAGISDSKYWGYENTYASRYRCSNRSSRTEVI